ncbi:MAG: hypothetical protein EOO50_11645 [Flavobacterium sp.]|uniref:hypothetical protein n=1 Tax=Flavobacterium sp. TaxID=239 RepID=UPI0011FB1070|nr:hypothetical protein [Flavobacterium sp.]RZJ65914.1 MAG: hypothetical protein EOO50_11645 [Flavobacterium sp.]
MKQNILVLLGFVCTVATAQETPQKSQQLQDSVKFAIVEKFPRTRMIDVQYRRYLPADFDSELDGNDYVKGRLVNHEKFSAAFNYLLIGRPRWNISATLNYRYESFDVEDVELLSADQGPFDENNGYHYLGATINAMYYGSLWKKPLVYLANVTVDGSDKNMERVKGFVGATLILKRTERTSIGVGIMVFIDPTSPVPLAPVFTVEHKFKDSPWSLDFILPQRALLKRPVFTNGRFSIGTELSGDGFYMYANNPNYANVYDFRTLELRSGITYEHYFGHGIVGYAKTGLSNMFNMRVSERGESTNDYVLSANRNATGYLSCGVSFSPTIRKKAKR